MFCHLIRERIEMLTHLSAYIPMEISYLHSLIKNKKQRYLCRGAAFKALFLTDRHLQRLCNIYYEENEV